MKIFTRSLTILNGEKAIIFSTAVTDPGKVADGRKAAEEMEQSVKF
jgi:hypothetical protein